MRKFTFCLLITLLEASGTAVAADVERERPFSVSWSKASSNPEGEYSDVVFSTSENGVLVGRSGAIALTADGGQNWRVVESPVQSNLWSAYFVDRSNGWAVGDRGTILATHDGGINWKPQSSGTENTLVSVRFADQKVGWVIGTKGAILSTVNGGETWSLHQLSQDEDYTAATFINNKEGWVVGLHGKIARTRTGGASWETLDSGTSRNLWGIYFANTQDGWVVGDSGTVLSTHDGGVHWEAGNSGTDRDLFKILFFNTATGWVVGSGGTILTTRNAGQDWRLQTSGTQHLLLAINFADQNTGWIVGYRGLLLKSSMPSFAPEVTQAVSEELGIFGEVDFRILLHEERDHPVNKVFIWARAARGPWSGLGAAHLASSAYWILVWRPSEFGFHPGDTIEYRLQPDEGGPPAFLYTGGFPFEPWWTRVWSQNRKLLTSIVIAFSVTLLILAGLAALLVLAPARIAELGSLPIGKDTSSLTMSPGAFVSWGNKLLQELIFPFLCRHPRVKSAWINAYRAGRVQFEGLSPVARQIFLLDVDVLDAWIARCAHKIEAGLRSVELLEQRQTYVEFPLNDVNGLCTIEHPNPEAFRPIFNRPRAVVSILGIGGAGKSTLACALGRWAFNPDPSRRITEHRIVPLFVVEETNDLFATLKLNLQKLLSGEEVSDDLVRGLLAKKRLLVIVDALSERSPETRRHIEQFDKLPERIQALVITSRILPDFGSIERTDLYPVRLDAKRIVPFIIGYLDRREREGPLREGRVQLQLAEKILALSEAGGQKAPVTALLVTMFVDSARSRIRTGHTLDDLPKLMPEIFIDYLRRLNMVSGTSTQQFADDVLIRASQAVASVSLGTNFIPRDFLANDAVSAISVNGAGLQAQLLLNQLVTAGVIEKRAPGGYVLLRFSLDPVAEYLAAMKHIIDMRSLNTRNWRKHLTQLTKMKGYPDTIDGYLGAFANCYRSLKLELSLPDLTFPWEESDDGYRRGRTRAESHNPLSLYSPY